MDVDTDGDGDCVDAGGSKRYFYCQDANYNVVALREGSNIVERYEYDPYGNVRIFKGYDSAEGHEDLTVVSDSIAGNPFLFAGYFHDNETGLYHVRHRMYSPTLARWLQRDSLGYVDSLDLYVYALLNPMIFADPYGQSIWDWFDDWDWQYNLNRVLKKLVELLLGGEPSVHPTFTFTPTDEPCCCDDKQYTVQKFHIGVRVEIKDIFNIDARGEGEWCGPPAERWPMDQGGCGDTVCVGVQGGGNVSKAVLASKLKKIPRVGKRLADWITKHAVVRFQVRGKYCWPGGWDGEVCITVRLFIFGFVKCVG